MNDNELRARFRRSQMWTSLLVSTLGIIIFMYPQPLFLMWLILWLISLFGVIDEENKIGKAMVKRR
jgi:hypothetical protein